MVSCPIRWPPADTRGHARPCGKAGQLAQAPGPPGRLRPQRLGNVSRLRGCWPASPRRRFAWAVGIALLTGLGTAMPPRPLRAQAAVEAQRRIDGATRARMLSALAGLVLLGFGMMALVWLGARITQRYRHSAPFFRPTPRPGEHDWARKPLVPPPDLPRRQRDDPPELGPMKGG
jgi:hypothetical protein